MLYGVELIFTFQLNIENGDVSWEDEEYFNKWEMDMRSQKDNKSVNEDIPDYNYDSDLVSQKEIEVEEFELKEESFENLRDEISDEKPVCINIKGDLKTEDIPSEVRGRGKPRGPYKKKKKWVNAVNAVNAVNSPNYTGSLYCDLCDKMIVAKKGTKIHRHKFDVHDIKNCDKCGKLFDNVYKMNSHVSRECPFLPKIKLKCEFCGRGLANKVRLREHIKAKHTDLEHCDICDKMVANLPGHKELKHDPKNLQQCHLCAFTTYGTNLQKHIKHMHRTYVKVSCPNCGVQIRDCNLTSHIRRAQCDRPEEERIIERFKCDQCEKTFHSQNAVNRHIRSIHNQEKPFKCEQCDYKSFARGNVYMHVKRVHEKRALHVSCPNCDQTVVNLEHHLKTYHKDVRE